MRNRQSFGRGGYGPPRLTPAQRAEVLRLYAAGQHTHRSLAALFRVSAAGIAAIIRKGQ